MTELNQGESTTPLTTQMTMKQITNAQYAEVDNINVTITGYAIDITGETSTPEAVWEECKAIR